MIYETFRNSLGSLGTSWRLFQTAVNNLITATGGPGGGQYIPPSPFAPWLAIAANEITALDNSVIAVETYPSITALLALVGPPFNTSLADIGGIDAQSGTGSALDQCRNGQNAEIATLANAVAAAIEDILDKSRKAVQGVNELTTPQSQNITTARISSTVDDISTYPVLTQEFGSPSSRSGDVAPSWGGSNGSGLGGFIQHSIGDVLGRTPRAEDPKSFVAALNACFSTREFEGRTVIEYNPRGFLGNTELGGSITGAQASIYLRAKNTLEDSLPLLERLEPLRPDADPQEVDAVRAIVRDEFQELVDELSNEGGPRVQRVDDLFELLLTHEFTLLDNGTSIYAVQNANLLREIGAGELGRLADVFGLTLDRVNTIIEEQNQTNFRVLRDYMRSFNTSWIEFRVGFVDGTENFLGTQLVRLSRTLAVINESVAEVGYAMNSVFLGPAERKTTRIDLPGNAIMTVDDLLSWVSEFAKGEAPRLIQDGGKQGVRRVAPTLRRLQGLVRDSNGRIRHTGAQHPRVRKSLTELHDQLRDAAQLAGAV